MGNLDRYDDGLTARAWWPFVKYGSLVLLALVTVTVVVLVWNK